MASLQARPPYTKDELAQLYPKNLELLQVQVVFRHGERTPVRHRLASAGVPEHWQMCDAASQFRAAFSSRAGEDSLRWQTMPYKRQIEGFGPHSGPAVVSPNGTAERVCLMGELTNRGRETTLALGERLRELYVKQLGFLNDKVEHSSYIYMRHSPITRAGESLFQVFAGLYPPEKRSPAFEPVVLVRNISEENLFPNESQCRRLALLAERFAEIAADKWNPILAGRATDAFGKYINGIVAVNGHPRVSGILDTVSSAQGNGVPLPAELVTEEALADVEAASVDEWFRGYVDEREYRRLGAGRLLGDLVDKMQKAARGKDVFKVGLYGAHDTTLGSLLASIDAFDGRWPRYTSSIAFEVFRKSSDSLFGRDEHYVRLRYNDKPLTLPGCKGHTSEGDSSLCTLAQFSKIVKEITPDDWSKECA